ncbi:MULTISPECIES: DUF1700 domain-containing protein [Lactobacillus]|uniref:DUF1700 domain-containing protein n=1 Tax=Lactobacillus TaxID=1578 RepID=UPI000D6F6A5D|nr:MULTISPECIES: DUF1700 domain-containing protein [Lactobacillus]AWN32770.1 hypothetical protein DLD54_00645 [Lactobacillus helsingborgensis]RMC54402.1 DUF1700 domain-containing protein [Lactobacillus sp. ESL0262]
MTKVIDDYISELEQNLVDLPAKDREDVVEFYREFLLDGDFVRRSTIDTELGTPKQLAINIMADYSTKEDSAPAKPETPKSNLKASWYILLGICAAPIGIPLILAILFVIFFLLAVFFGLFFALVAFLFKFFVGGGLNFLRSLALLFTSNWPTGCIYLGKSLICIGVILLLLPFIVKLGQILIAKCTQIIRNLGKNLLKKNYFQTSSEKNTNEDK